MTNAEAYKLFCKDMIRAIGGMSIPGIDLNYGLCSNLSSWQCCKSDVPYDIDSYQEQLFSYLPTPDSPFNPYEDYTEERIDGRLYQNEARLKWIQDHAV